MIESQTIPAVNKVSLQYCMHTIMAAAKLNTCPSCTQFSTHLAMKLQLCSKVCKAHEAVCPAKVDCGQLHDSLLGLSYLLSVIYSKLIITPIARVDSTKLKSYYLRKP